MSFFLELLNNVIVPFFAGLALPLFVILVPVFLIIVVLKKGRPGKAWYIIGVPVAFYAALALLWMLANIVGGASAVPENDLLPSASYEVEE